MAAVVLLSEGRGRPLAAAPAAAAGLNPIQLENQKPGDGQWRLGHQGSQAPAPTIEGYATPLSASPGEAVGIHVSTNPNASYRIEISRLGWYQGAGGRRVACLPDPACGGGEPGSARRVPAPDSNGEIQAGWPTTDTLQIPPDWVSGYYVANLILTNGPHRGQATSVPFVVSGGSTNTSAIRGVVPVNTWEAYNLWGGKSLYSSTSQGPPATHVAFARPFAVAQNQSFELFASEYPLVRFLEREGYDISYMTDADLDRAPAALLAHRLVMSIGHGEYWTSGMRTAYEAARAGGVNLAFMGSNTGYWQMRYDPGRDAIIEYRAAQADPLADKSLKTVRFRHLTPPRPECALLGVQYQYGRGADVKAPSSGAYSPDPTALSDSWMHGTGFHPGDAVPGTVGPEWDATQDGCPTPPLTRLFGWSGSGYYGPTRADAVRYQAPSGALVFSTGSTQFSSGLDGFGSGRAASPPLQQFMRNALADLLQRHTPPSAPAVGPAPVAPSPACALAPSRHAVYLRRARARGRRRSFADIYLRCSQASTIVASGRLQGRRGRRRTRRMALRTARVRVRAARTTRVSLRAPEAAFSALRRRFRESARVRLAITTGAARSSVELLLPVHVAGARHRARRRRH